MAGQAQKKVEASNMALLTHLSLGLLISLVFYFGLNFWSGGEDISYIMIGITLLVDSILGLMLYSSAKSEANYDLKKDGFFHYYCDVIMLSILTLFLAAFSSYFWWIYLLVPIFFCYKVVNLIFSGLAFKNSMSQGGAVEEDQSGKRVKRKVIRR